MSYKYDDQNVFAKILRGEIPNDTIYEDDYALAFRDINPQAPSHVLVIPKGSYVTYDHFANEASDAEIIGYIRAIGTVCKMLEIEPGHQGAGYRAISNAGENGLQDVPHLHMHILSGKPLGPLLSSR